MDRHELWEARKKREAARRRRCKLGIGTRLDYAREVQRLLKEAIENARLIEKAKR